MSNNGASAVSVDAQQCGSKCSTSNMLQVPLGTLPVTGMPIQGGSVSLVFDPSGTNASVLRIDVPMQYPGGAASAIQQLVAAAALSSNANRASAPAPIPMQFPVALPIPVVFPQGGFSAPIADDGAAPSTLARVSHADKGDAPCRRPCLSHLGFGATQVPTVPSQNGSDARVVAHNHNKTVNGRGVASSAHQTRDTRLDVPVISRSHESRHTRKEPPVANANPVSHAGSPTQEVPVSIKTGVKSEKKQLANPVKAERKNSSKSSTLHPERGYARIRNTKRYTLWYKTAHAKELPQPPRILSPKKHAIYIHHPIAGRPQIWLWKRPSGSVAESDDDMDVDCSGSTRDHSESGKGKDRGEKPTGYAWVEVREGIEHPRMETHMLLVLEDGTPRWVPKASWCKYKRKRAKARRYALACRDR